MAEAPDTSDTEYRVPSCVSPALPAYSNGSRRISDCVVANNGAIASYLIIHHAYLTKPGAPRGAWRSFVNIHYCITSWVDHIISPHPPPPILSVHMLPLRRTLLSNTRLIHLSRHFTTSPSKMAPSSSALAIIAGVGPGTGASVARKFART